MSSPSGESLSDLWRSAERFDPVKEHKVGSRIFKRLFERPFAQAQVDRYVLLDHLGQGGAGKVYRAYDPQLRRHVAVKLLHAKRETDAVGEERLLREARVVANLSHPNIIAVHDIGRLPSDAPIHAGTIFVVMEVVDGLPLDRWSETEKWGWRRIVELFEAAAAGVMAAHSKGVVHRDLKPSNMLVGDDGRIRVLDFGLARAAGISIGTEDAASHEEGSGEGVVPSSRDVTLTREGAVMGTPTFMAPEQHAAEPATAQSDQFSLCATFWVVLFGALPFKKGSLSELAKAKRAGPPRPPVRGRAPTWFVEVLQRGLQPDASDRFPNVEALLAQLQRKRRWSRWKKPLVAATAVGLVTVSAWGLRERAIATRCEAEGAAIHAVWNDETRAEVRARSSEPLSPIATGYSIRMKAFRGW